VRLGFPLTEILAIVEFRTLGLSCYKSGASDALRFS